MTIALVVINMKELILVRTYFLVSSLCVALAACGGNESSLPYPGGLDYSPAQKAFFVGDRRDGAIQTVDLQGRTALFQPAGKDGRTRALRMSRT